MAAAWRNLIIVGLLLAGFAVKGALIAPPPVPTNTSPSEFDTQRAIARLQRILGDQRPHPVDSDADDAVRGRLVAELKLIGLQPRLQETMDCSAMPKTRVVSCSRVHNVIAALPSIRPGPQLLLNAHYDSTPTGPGAADDGLGVATLLEVGSILKAAPPQRPVTLLFNEGEEFGLNGAHAFVRPDSSARDINSLINIDVRGVTGPALMYETSVPNATAITAYAAGARRPYANSISTDFARLIPNTTDAVFFKPAGWTLLNYSIIGNETRYHSPGDTIAALDPRSVGHVGSEVLAATRTMADLRTPAPAVSGREVFTDIGGRAFVDLPLTLAAGILALLLLVALFLAWRRRALGKPLLVAAGMTMSGIAAAALASWLLGLLRAGDFWRAYPLVSYLAIYAALLLTMAATYARWGRRLDLAPLRAAAWLLVLLLGSALSFALPGATIFFLIAPSIALVSVALTNRAPAASLLLAIIAAAVQFLMFAELLALIEMLLIDGPLWAVAPLAALAALPAIVEARAAALRPALIALTTATVGFAVAAIAMPRPSTDRPLSFSIDYFRDVPGDKAFWAVATKQAPLPKRFPGAWKPGVLAYNGRTRWIMPAPTLPTRAGRAALVSSEVQGAGRRVRIILSPGGAHTIAIRFGKDARVLALGLPDAAVPIPAAGDQDRAILRCTGRSCAGLQIEVLFGDRTPVDAEIFTTSFGLPVEARPLIAARPANAIPQYAPDQTITRTIVKF
jgi:hypothetical protein